MAKLEVVFNPENRKIEVGKAAFGCLKHPLTFNHFSKRVIEANFGENSFLNYGKFIRDSKIYVTEYDTMCIFDEEDCAKIKTREQKAKDSGMKVLSIKQASIAWVKASNKHNCDLIGGSMAYLYKGYKAKYRWHFIHEPYEYIKPVWTKVGFRVMVNNPKRFNIAKQLEQDNLVHLAPICIITGASPKECREYFGKGKWKKICKLNKTNIGYLAKIIESSTRRVGANDMPSTLARLPLDKFLELPASLRSKIPDRDFAFNLWYAKNCKGSYTNKAVFDRNVNLWFDCRRMLNRMNYDYSMLDRATDLQVLHDNLVQEMRNYIKPAFELKEEFPYKDLILNLMQGVTVGDYVVVPMTCGNDLLNEGRLQNHCVGGYHSTCLSTRALIFSLRHSSDTTKPVSTLELRRIVRNDDRNVAKDVYYVFGQHMASHNRYITADGKTDSHGADLSTLSKERIVTNKDLVTLATKVLEVVNNSQELKAISLQKLTEQYNLKPNLHLGVFNDQAA